MLLHKHRFWIETLGCPKNTVDSKRMYFSMIQCGFRPAANIEQAKLFIINSCAFIETAKQETIDTIFSYLSLKEKQEDTMVVLVGCFAERFSEVIINEIPELDMVIGTGKFQDVPILLAEKFNIPYQIHEAEFYEQDYSTFTKPYSYFRIGRGCSRKCSFCILPSIRGPLQPYDLDEIKLQVEEEKRFRKDVTLKEAILVSQDPISQGVERLSEYISFFSDIKEINWIRLQYLFPDSRILKLCNLFQEFPKLASYLDIPFQHVSVPMLKKMNRPSDIYTFYSIIEKWKRIRPQGEIRTSFIIGYPGETEQDIDRIIEFITDYHIEKIALFPYSHEEGTPAHAKYDDHIPEKDKVDRINYIREKHIELRNLKRQEKIGSIEIVTIDEIYEEEIVARREQDSPDIDEVIFLTSNQKHKIGDLVPVQLDTAMEYDWLASVVEAPVHASK